MQLRRRELIAATWSADADYRDPLLAGAGHDGIDAMIRAVHERFPHHTFHRTTEVDGFANRLRFSWAAHHAGRRGDRQGIRLRRARHARPLAGGDRFPRPGALPLPELTQLFHGDDHARVRCRHGSRYCPSRSRACRALSTRSPARSPASLCWPARARSPSPRCWPGASRCWAARVSCCSRWLDGCGGGVARMPLAASCGKAD